MSLDRSAECPAVHAVGADADRSAPAAGAEGEDLVEAVEQAGPLLLVDEPFELRPIGGELRLGEPLLEVLEGLFLEFRSGFHSAKPGGGLGQKIHRQPRKRWEMIESRTIE